MINLDNYIIEKLHISKGMKSANDAERADVKNFIIDFLNDYYHLKNKEDYNMVFYTNEREHNTIDINFTKKDGPLKAGIKFSKLCQDMEKELGYDYYWSYSSDMVNLEEDGMI